MSFTNAQLAQQVNDLVSYFTTFAIEYSQWNSGVAGGGPGSDGLYALTDYFGNRVLVPCPAQLAADVAGQVNSAAASATAAAASEVSAQNAEDTAVTSAQNSASARDLAQVYQTAASTSAIAAQNAEVNAVAQAAVAQAAADSITVSGTEPASPSTDDLWFDTATPAIKYYNGSIWVSF